MMVTANPRLLALDPETGLYTSDVMDFWRPNYRDQALVDGKYSTRVYLQALQECWKQYRDLSGRGFADLHRYCYHLPFTRMAEKAHERLAKDERGGP
jgi:hydroxymethylglutaryl-CoA synthase